MTNFLINTISFDEPNYNMYFFGTKLQYNFSPLKKIRYSFKKDQIYIFFKNRKDPF